MGSRQRIVATGLTVLALGVGVTACGSDGGDSSATPAGASSTDAADRAGTEITIENFAFAPKTLRAHAGATVTVTNTDDTTHTVTADDGAFDTGDVAASTAATFVVGGPGRYRYHCNIHNYMTGTVIVSD